MKKIYYFDYLRIIALISVVFMHTVAGRLRMDIDKGWHILNFLTSFAFSAVPLFFMISGYLLLNNKRTLDLKVLKNRLKRLFIPLMSWSIVIAFWLNFINKGDIKSLIAMFSNLLRYAIMPHLWFMYVLIPIYILSPFLYSALNFLDSNGKKYLFYLIVLIFINSIFKIVIPHLNIEILTNLSNIDFLNKINFFGGHLATFFLGYYLGNIDKKFSNIKLIIISIIDVLIIAMGTYYLVIKTGSYDQNLYINFQDQSAGFEVLLASNIFLLFKQNFNKNYRINEILSSFVALSFPIYIIHNLIISIFYYFGFSFVRIINIFSITFLNLFISYIILYLISYNKYLCFLFTGIDYEKLCQIKKVNSK